MQAMLRIWSQIEIKNVCVVFLKSRHNKHLYRQFPSTCDMQRMVNNDNFRKLTGYDLLNDPKNDLCNKEVINASYPYISILNRI